MKEVLVSGGNRGIGLGFVKEYLRRGASVAATCRSPAEAKRLKELKDAYPSSLWIVQLDVVNAGEVASLPERLGSRADHLDLLINNAGVYPPNKFDTVTEDQMIEAYRVNTIAPLLISRTLAPLLKKAPHPLIVCISSLLGSVAEGAGAGRWAEYAYGTSKAGLNRVVRQLAIDLKPLGVTVTSQYPGWVRTEMGGDDAALSVEESVAAMAKVFDRLTPRDSGRVIDLDGTDAPI